MDPILTVYAMLIISLLACLIFFKPFYGLLLIIVVNVIENIIALRLPLTTGRAIGVLVFVGWTFNYAFRRKSLLFHARGFNLLAIGFIVVMFLSSLLASDPSRSLQLALTVTLLVMMTFFLQDFINDSRRLSQLIYTIALSVGVISVVGIVQHNMLASGQQTFGTIQAGGTRVGGFQSNVNGYAAILMSGIPLLFFLTLNDKNRVFRLIFLTFLLTSVVSLCLTLSRTHILGLLVFFIAYTYLTVMCKRLSTKRLFSFLFMVLALGLLTQFYLFDIINERVIQYTFSGTDTSAQSRLGVLFKAMELLLANPALGIGFGNLELSYVADYTYVSDIPGHDIISGLFVSTGFLGGILFLGLCFKTILNYNLAVKSFVHHKYGYLRNLSVVLLSALVALLLTFLVNPLIFQRILWIHAALSVIFYRWVVSATTINEKDENAWVK